MFEARSNKSQAAHTNVEQDNRKETPFKLAMLVKWSEFVTAVKILDTFIQK